VSTDLERIVAFLRTIGLEVRYEEIEGATVLPGMTVDHGVLVVDEARLAHVGDLLHEAGHLAVVPPGERSAMTVDMGSDGGMEMAALAWSYAAARHLDLAPEVVFHDEGYRGDARNLVENFDQGRYVGVPILVWRGMTTTEAFPSMATWLAP
jgi:hypothetical protein